MQSKTTLRSTTFALATAAAAVIAVTAWAQQQSHGAHEPQRTADTTLAEWLVDKDARVSELVGLRVLDPHGTDVGEVEDLLATPDREQQPVIVLSIGGVLDIGDKWHAVSLDQLRLAADGERLVIDKTEQELKAAPSFDYVPRVGERSHQPGVTGPSTTNSIGRLIGATVVDDAGKSLGEIEDLVVSTGDKGTRAVVELDDDAVAGHDARRVAIPFEVLTIELSAEEAAAVPQQARVRVDGETLPVETLPVYQYQDREPI
jgi:sporulation protein YlmC with PRC-barrel domain